MSIGARFLAIRNARKLNQSDVAAMLGISHGALVNYEKDARDPPVAVVIAFAREFQVSASWLLTGEGRPEASELDDLYGRSIHIAWAYLSRGGDPVELAPLVRLGGALFTYLLEHGEISTAMTDKLLALSA